MRTQRPPQRPDRPRGFSIAEVMVSLAISALLLVAVAAAYTASANAVDGNDRFFRATQAARVSMNQLLTEIRRANSIDTADVAPFDTVFVTRDPDLRVFEENYREFKYDSVGKKITLKIHYKRADGTTYSSPLYTLCRNVTECSFGPAAKDAAGVELRVPVTVVVTTGGHSVRLSDTSGPRRAAN